MCRRWIFSEYPEAGHFPAAEELENKGQLASISFGQGKMLLTPVHVMAYMNIFANNVTILQPNYTTSDRIGQRAY